MAADTPVTAAVPPDYRVFARAVRPLNTLYPKNITVNVP